MTNELFNKLSTTKKIVYDQFNGIEPFDITYKLLSTRDTINAQKYEPQEDAILYMLLLSIQDGYNANLEGDEKPLCVEDIADLPAFVTNQMIKDMLEFNNINIDELMKEAEK